MKKINKWKLGAIVAAILVCSGCATTDLNKGFSKLTDSTGNDKASSESGTLGNNKARGDQQLVETCSRPIGTIAVYEPGDYAAFAAQQGLPGTTIPFVNHFLGKTNCFTVVNRGAGFNAAMAESSYAQGGYTNGANSPKKAQLAAAEYTFTSQITASNNGMGVAQLGGAVNAIFPGSGLLFAAARSGEAQVTVTVTRNATGTDVVVAEGSPRSGTIGLDGIFSGGSVAGGVGAWNTVRGKIVAAAYIDAINKMVISIRDRK